MSINAQLIRMLNKLNQSEIAALLAILSEYKRATDKHPVCPSDDLIHAASIVTEEVGELVRECNQLEMEIELTNYNEILQCSDRITLEATQVGAMGFRFLVNLIDPAKL